MSVNTRPAMRPTVAVFAVQTLIQHLELTRRLKAEMQNLKRPPSPVSPEPGRDAA
jgi:hypothetical protein